MLGFIKKCFLVIRLVFFIDFNKRKSLSYISMNNEECKVKHSVIVSVIIKNVVMIINAGVNAKNWLMNVYVIKDLFAILVIVSANVINPVKLVNI